MAIDRRSLITGVAPALALGTVLAGATVTTAGAAGSTLTGIGLIEPFRLQDSRVHEPDKYSTGATDGLAVPGIGDHVGVMLNVTVTATEGRGFVWVGKEPTDPVPTSNLNWYGDDQTIANLAIVNTGPGAGGITLQLRGAGRAHVIIDVLAFLSPIAT